MSETREITPSSEILRQFPLEGITLERPDLAELGLRVIDTLVKRGNRLTAPKREINKGSLSIPSDLSRFSHVPRGFVSDALNILRGKGISVEKAGKGRGNTVISFAERSKVASVVDSVQPGVLMKLGLFIMEHCPVIDSITLFPNANPDFNPVLRQSKLNGISIETVAGIKTKKLIELIGALGRWPFERRLEVLKLLYFDATDNKLKMLKRAELDPNIKFADLFSNEEKPEEFYMALSSGPSAELRECFIRRIIAASNISELRRIYVKLQEAAGRGSDYALSLTLGLLGLSPRGVERVSTNPYIRLVRANNGGWYIYSGGALIERSGETPFTLPDNDMFVYIPPPPLLGKVLPIGTKLSPPKAGKPLPLEVKNVLRLISLS